MEAAWMQRWDMLDRLHPFTFFLWVCRKPGWPAAFTYTALNWDFIDIWEWYFFFFPGLKKEFFSFPIFYCNILLPLSLLQVDDLNTDPRKQKVLIRHQQKQFFFILISVHLRYHVSSYSNFLFFCWQEWVYAPGSLKLQLGFLQFSSRISNLQDIVHFVHLGHVSFILSDPFEMGMHIFSHRVYFLSLAVCN